MKIVFQISVIVVLFFGHAAVAKEVQQTRLPAVLAATSNWTNQSGSVASFSLSPSVNQPNVYDVSGTYTNNNSSFRCLGTPYPLTGTYYAGTGAVSFSVSWSNTTEDCQSVTGWTGYFDIGSAPARLLTDWNLAFHSLNGMAIMAGKDVFTFTK